MAITSSIHPDPVTHVEPVRYGRGSNLLALLGTVLVDGDQPVKRWRAGVRELRRNLRDLPRLQNPRHWSERTIVLLVMQSLDNSITTSLRKRRWLGRRLTSSAGDGEPNPSWIPAGHEVARRVADKIDGMAGGTWGDLIDMPVTGHLIGGCVIGDSPGHRRRRRLPAPLRPRRAARGRRFDGLGQPRRQPVADDHRPGRAGDVAVAEQGRGRRRGRRSARRTSGWHPSPRSTRWCPSRRARRAAPARRGRAAARPRPVRRGSTRRRSRHDRLPARSPGTCAASCTASAFLVPLADVPVDLPPGCTPVRVGGRGVVGTAWVSYEPGGVLSYREVMATLLVRRGRRVMPTIMRIWVDSEASRDGGRALWGIPKDLATLRVPRARLRRPRREGPDRHRDGAPTAAAARPAAGRLLDRPVAGRRGRWSARCARARRWPCPRPASTPIPPARWASWPGAGPSRPSRCATSG